LALILYVDDLFLTGSHTKKIQWLVQQLQTKFQMTNLSRISTYFGIEFEFTPTGLRLHQTKFAQSILDELSMTDANSTLTPLPNGLKLWADMGAAPVDSFTYQSLVGKFIFLTHTRPDLIYSVNLVNWFMHSPQLPHL
jgi:hypothetical protein